MHACKTDEHRHTHTRTHAHTQVGTSPRYECFGGPRAGQACSDESFCSGTGGEVVSCSPAWAIRTCTHAKTCSHGDGAADKPAPKRCRTDAECPANPLNPADKGKCLLPEHKMGAPLPHPLFGMNCSSDADCSTEDKDGQRILGSCEASWSLCREMFDMDRASLKVPLPARPCTRVAPSIRR